MYIAFKWLLGLTFVMWIAMCSIDIFVKKSKEITDGDFEIRPSILHDVKNRTVSEKNKFHYHKAAPLSFAHGIRDKQTSMIYLHCIMFVAGALVMSLYKKIHTIYSITRRELYTVFTSANAKKLQEYFKIIATETNKIVILVYQTTLESLKTVILKLIDTIMKLKLTQKPRINQLLLQKIKELGEERKNLAQLLIAAIHENKNLRMQYQLENMAKNRLVRHIENTQKAIKENRSKYVSFQQLYLVTHQENLFLKSRLKKLTKEKEEASTNLLELVNEIYKSKNNDLRVYCSRFIVKNKDNIINSSVGLHTFVNGNSPFAKTKLSNPEFSDLTAHELYTENPNYTSCTEVTQYLSNTSVLPFCTEAPKLKGLPGEYVWTVKDKDGLIEKLYEYDFESDFENGDTIRRIREYSVYFDKDCLLDFSNSSTVFSETRTARSETFDPKVALEFPLTNQKFLTGSEAFQRFMENNKNIVSTSMLPVSRLS